MSETIRKAGLFKTREAEPDTERQEILGEIESTREQLRLARISFDNVSEPELVDASIYEINSLQARYSYLLRRAREEGFEKRETFKERKGSGQ